MGTNYYISHKDENLRKIFEDVHLGKNSYGWYFSLHVYPERGISSWKNWEHILENGRDLIIVDEYENTCSLDEFKLLLMKDRSSDKAVSIERLEQEIIDESPCCNVKLDRDRKLLYQGASELINCLGPDQDVRATLLTGDFS